MLRPSTKSESLRRMWHGPTDGIMLPPNPGSAQIQSARRVHLTTACPRFSIESQAEARILAPMLAYIPMALRSTVYKADLQVADMDRSHYADYPLTLARHPSETEERLMIRLLAFALHADPALEFGRGLSTDDEPDLWRRDLTGVIEQWIDVGLPDERLIRKACGRAREVVVITYGGNKAQAWWSQHERDLTRFENLRVLSLAPDQTEALGKLAARSLKISCSIQDGQVWFSTGDGSASIEPGVLAESKPRGAYR